MTHEVKIRFENDSATLSIDNNTMNIDANIAAIITNAIITYIDEWFMPEDNTNTFTAPLSGMRIKMEKTKDEITFTFEE